MSIHSLPNETLEIIFSFHVYELCGFRTALQLVCKRWNATAISFPALWTRVSWSPTIPPPHPSVNCRTLDALARAINRTAQATMDVTLEIPNAVPPPTELESFLSSANPTWPSRCTSLKIITTCDFYGRSLEGPLACLLLNTTSGFDALRTLILSHVDVVRCKMDLSSFLIRVGHSAHSLHRLELDYDDDVPLGLVQALITSGIFRRIQELKIPTSIGHVPWEALPNLCHLDVVFVDSLLCSCTSLAGLVAPKLASLRLEGPFHHIQLPPATIIRQLRRLEMVRISQGLVHALSAMRTNVDAVVP
ncbi:hypothetical protein M408DRAFT_24881 [Serendipita vermifera MAFF 305830]|uniref:F-box domain-containing protein n=1 Tax=Serendipita vermifera MAFF 305830 TaxID=933852 RepID=A0A0C3B4P5_SERVB|nr:hypothetical protein M408DRAFT_24881 [Serendipita vermifera MAFF 305830]